MKLGSFKNPEAMFRPVPFWSWNDNLEKAELKRQINEMIQKGWGGYFCHSRVGLVTEYLSEEWMDMVNMCAEEAGKLGTYAWLYDEDKWPSGFASGVLAQDEKNRDRSIVLAKKEEIAPGDTILKEFIHDSVEYVVCKHIMPMGDEWFNGATYVDLMNPDTVKEFLDSTHEKYKEASGKYFGKEIPGIFTDEPCYFMKKYYKDNHFINMRALPWSEHLPDYFEKLKGYSIFDHIEELFLNINDYRKTRFDFYDGATRLFVESFTKQYAEWCSGNNLKMTGHYMGEDSMMLQTEYIGAAMPHYEHMQWPGIDKLKRNIEDLVTVKQLTSVTDQLNKDRAFCETFGCMGQHTSFFHRKWIADWQAVLGINFVNHHLSLYSMRGERKRDYPPNFFYQQPWWDCEKPFADYIGRLSYAITQGKRDVDILVIHPIANAWCEYTPQEELEGTLSSIKHSQAQLNQLSLSLLANKFDFHYGDEIIMENHAKVEKGKLVIGSHSYSTVIIPTVVTLRQNTFKLLEAFTEAAEDNSIILMTPITQRLDGSPCTLSWPQNAKTADDIHEVMYTLEGKYPERISIKNNVDGRNAEKILVQERTSAEGNYVFIANTDEIGDIDTSISIKSSYTPVVMDLASGDMYKVTFEKESERIIIQVRFKPAGSLLLYFPHGEVTAKKAPAVLDSGVEFKTTYEKVNTVDWCSFTINEKNVFKLDRLTLSMDGLEVLKNEIVPKAWFDIFYVAKDGTPFSAQYDFNVTCAPEGELFAVIEMAENLEEISLNGVKLKPLKHRDDPFIFDENKNWKDLSFTKIPFEASILKEGRNTLVIEGKKVNNITGQGTHKHVENVKQHRPTELENVYIVGNFTVKEEERKRFFIDGSKVTINPEDITSTGYPFYAGSVTVQYSFNLNDKKDIEYIKVNNLNAACMEMTVNGEYADVKYWDPYIYDVSSLLREGENRISVKIYTTLFNLMGPNHIEDILDRTGVGTYTFVDLKKYTESYVLLPFGVGSIELMK